MIRFTLLDTAPYFDTPYHLVGWIGWFLMAAVILWVLRQSRQDAKPAQFWKKFILLFLATLVLSFFFGVDLPIDGNLPLPNVPREASLPTVMLFAFIPLILAGGLLGSLPAALL